MPGIIVQITSSIANTTEPTGQVRNHAPHPESARPATTSRHDHGPRKLPCTSSTVATMPEAQASEPTKHATFTQR